MLSYAGFELSENSVEKLSLEINWSFISVFQIENDRPLVSCEINLKLYKN